MDPTRELGHQEMLFLNLNRMEGPIGQYVSISIVQSESEIHLPDVKNAFEV